MADVEFRYFRSPRRYSTFGSSPGLCAICGLERPGYDGPFYGTDLKLNFVCEGCLITGKLAPLGVRVNTGDDVALARQLVHRRKELSAEGIIRELRRLTAELEERTPPWITWQDLNWPAHCGDYCHFIREVGQPDLKTLGTDGDGMTFLKSNLVEADRDADLEQIWQSIRPDSPEDNSVSYPVGIYLFQCLHCRSLLLRWDCD